MNFTTLTLEIIECHLRITKEFIKENLYKYLQIFELQL